MACFIVFFAAPPLFELSNKWFGVPSGLFFLCGFISLASFLFILKKLPETKGKTLEEIAGVWSARCKLSKSKADEMVADAKAFGKMMCKAVLFFSLIWIFYAMGVSIVGIFKIRG